MGISIASLSPDALQWQLAINLVILGILFSGIAMGIGRAFASKRIWRFGVEELAQAIVNAAILGVLISWAVSVDSITSNWVEDTALSCPDAQANVPLQYAQCFLQTTYDRIIPTHSLLSSLSYKLGWLSGLSISTDVITAQPFFSLGEIANTYTNEAHALSGFASSLQFQLQFLNLTAQSAFALFLPIGLLLRMFFLTRKIGGAVMAASIGFYIVYPLAYSALISPSIVLGSFDSVSMQVEQSIASLGPVPIADFGKSAEVSTLISTLSSGDIASTATSPFPAISTLSAILGLSLIAYPLISLAITIVAISQLYGVLASEFNLNLFEIL